MNKLYSAARAIAENEFVLSAIRQQKIVVIERLKEATAIALRKGDCRLSMSALPPKADIVQHGGNVR